MTIAENNTPTQKVAPDVETLALAMLNAGMTAQIGLMLTVPVPASDIMNLLCEHLGKLLALIEPMQLRNSILAEIRQNLPAVVNRHVQARMTTPGGVFLPDQAQRMQ